MPSINIQQSNPAYSKVIDVALSRDGTQSSLSIFKPNVFCRFEKIEFIESIFELFPSGSLTVRDTSDIITFITGNSFDTIVVTFLNGAKFTFAITSTAYITNAASETEENFVAINFSNQLYKASQDNSLIKIMDTKKPSVYKINELVSTIVTKSETILSKYPDAAPPTPITIDNTSNYALYRPLNPLEDKIEIANENFIQYLYYLSSLACEETSKEPNYLFWTGFQNTLNFKYFYRNIEDDEVKTKRLDDFNLRYAIYESEVPTQNIPRGGKKYNKIYILTTEPADQFVSKKYYYVRKTPKILNKQQTNSQTNNTELLTFQFQDDGEKFDIEIIGSDGVLNQIQPGADELKYNSHFGYYDSSLPENRVSLPSHINQNLGTSGKYKDTDFMGFEGAFPYVDNTEMWKNMFDMTPLHPNVSTEKDDPGSSTELQKVMNIRDSVFANNSGTSLSLQKIREIERQNFVAYVLCCIKSTALQEETFFAQLTGYIRDSSEGTTNQTGVHNEPLKYFYSWKRLKYVNTNFNTITPFAPFFRNEFHMIENSGAWNWDNDSEGSILDDKSTWAINLNERANRYSGQNIAESYYAPGWYAKNLDEATYQDVKYRPIGQRIDELDTVENFSEFKMHIVRMTKTPKKLLLIEAGVEDEEILNYYADKYLYTFAAENVTDGPCSTDQQNG